MHRIGHFVFQSLVRALPVMDIRCLALHLARLHQVLRAVDKRFVLQDAVDPPASAFW